MEVFSNYEGDFQLAIQDAKSKLASVSSITDAGMYIVCPKEESVPFKENEQDQFKRRRKLV